MFEDSPEPFDPRDELPKPKVDDILILKDIPAINSENAKEVRVEIVWDSLAESWDPVGEAAWTQREVNEQVGFRGHWYAYVSTTNDEYGSWSVASWEVESIKERT